jgi:hypothetical protein
VQARDDRGLGIGEVAEHADQRRAQRDPLRAGQDIDLRLIAQVSKQLRLQLDLALDTVHGLEDQLAVRLSRIGRQGQSILRPSQRAPALGK